MASSLTFDQINDLEDVMEAFDLLEELNIDADDVEELEDAQKKLRQYLQQQNQQENPSSVIGSALRDIAVINQKTQDELLKILHDVHDVVNKMPERCRNGVKEVWPTVERDLTGSIEQLKTSSPSILVAGETGSGKSSFLNLLLGELANELLPVASLSSTSVITELRYGAEKYLVAYPRDPSRRPIKKELGSDASQVLSQYIHQKGMRSQTFPYIRVEVFWPCEWLQGGIGIVDSPGVGEDDELTEMVKAYIPRAAGFIYVINTPNAGGIDPDRLQDLVLSHVATASSSQTDEDSAFHPATALFVCNKWDQVPMKERDRVKSVVKEKLTEMWPGFQEDQLFFLSTKQTMEELQENIMSDHYKKLVKGIERLIPIGFIAKMMPHYQFAMRVLERCLLEMRTYIRSKEIHEKKAYLEVAKDKLHYLKTRSDQIVNQLKNNMACEIRKVTRDLEEYLRSRTGQSSICHWDVEDCPQSRDYNKLEALKEAYVQKRIRTEISKWDNRNRQLEKIQQNLSNAFSQHFIDIDQELHDIEDYIVDGKLSSNAIYGKDSNSFDPGQNTPLLTNRQRAIIIGSVTAPIWVPLGVAASIVVLPTLGIKKVIEHKRQLRISRQYSVDPAKEMSELTRHALDMIITTKELDRIVESHFSQVFESFKRLFQHLPQVIQADEVLIRKLAIYIEEKTEDRKICAELCKAAESIKDDLSYLYLTRLGHYPTDLDEYTDWKFLGEGSFAKVYRATQKNGKGYVALKSLIKPISKESAHEFLTEERNLRTLQNCDNVISFYGTVIKIVDSEWYPILVMEYCDKTLDKIVYSHEYQSPGRCNPDKKRVAMRNAVGFATGICKGLHHIHSIGFIHRDLKLENVLVCDKNQVKIADLGLAKSIREIKGTVMGTPRYMAPEVWREEKYSQKADIFSFGMAMWELWFGCCVAAKFKVWKLDEFKEDPYPGGKPPDPAWKDLMQQCWEMNSEARPSADQCLEKLRKAYGREKYFAEML